MESMSGTNRWAATSFDTARDEVIATLRTYRVERQNVQRQKELVQEALEGLYEPRRSGDMVDGKSPAVSADDSMVRSLGRIGSERVGLERELAEIHKQEDRLNTYLRAVCALPSFEKRVVVGLYLDGKAPADVCAETGKSDDSMVRYRKSAIRRLTRTLYRVEVRAWLAERE
jgi:DNA-directed RNA polymerase specialized sigma24 family protein